MEFSRTFVVDKEQHSFVPIGLILNIRGMFGLSSHNVYGVAVKFPELQLKQKLCGECIYALYCFY